jgi:hypothetical protein
MMRLAKETASLVAMFVFLGWFALAALWATAVQGKSMSEQEPLL